ncbi:MAG: hypothetical protein Q8Q26_09635 [Pseudorhodobacter sp.]|nr:hypothetical protein [Pseudorhodobacter sp.]
MTEVRASDVGWVALGDLAEARLSAVARIRLAEGLSRAIAASHPADAVQIMAAALEDMGGGGPEYAGLVDAARSDAEFWAEVASPILLETYLAAILRLLPHRAFGLPARKRLLVALWGSLSPKDRHAFVARVAPDLAAGGGR